MDRDQVVLGVEAVHLDERAGGTGAEGDDEGEVPIALQLGPLAEVLCVLDRQRVEAEGALQQSLRAVLVEVGEVEPEPRRGVDEFPQGRLGDLVLPPSGVTR